MSFLLPGERAVQSEPTGDRLLAVHEMMRGSPVFAYQMGIPAALAALEEGDVDGALVIADHNFG